jgi:hypothetical protein
MIKCLLTLLLSLAICAPANATQSNPVAGATYTSDFTSGALDSRYTFTRASSGSYYNSSGILTQASSNVPRFDYNPSTLAMNGLLIEGSATNMLPQSNTFANNGFPWNWQGNLITANYGVSPDGTMNASRIYSSAVGTTQSSLMYLTSVGLNGPASFYVKALTGTWVGLSTGSAGAQTTGAFFNVATGTIGTVAAGVTARMQALPNGWYRISTTIATGGFVLLELHSADNQAPIYLNGTEDFLIYGAQGENAAFPSSYIPTTTTAVTRAADYCINTSIGGWFNNSQGTFTAEFITAPVVQAYQVASAFSDGTSSNRLDIIAGYGSGASAIFWQNSLYTSAPSTPVAITANAVHKIGYSYNGSVLQGAQDGVLTSTIPGSSLVIPTLNQLNIGSDPAGTQLFGWIRKFRYWNKMLTNAQLQKVTQ